MPVKISLSIPAPPVPTISFHHPATPNGNDAARPLNVATSLPA
jgi:hypothetical protein